jgi:hypothetical protein
MNRPAGMKDAGETTYGAQVPWILSRTTTQSLEKKNYASTYV